MIFNPVGSSDIEITSAPSSLNTLGATSYAAPFAESITILRFFKEISFESEFLQYSIYLPLASESREAFPSFSGFTTSIGCEIFSSIKSSSSSEIFLPWSSKNFIPLSS